MEAMNEHFEWKGRIIAGGLKRRHVAELNYVMLVGVTVFQKLECQFSAN